MTLRLFAVGGVLRDCVVEAGGALHLDQPGGNGVFAASAALLFTQPVGVVGHVPGDYPQSMLDALGAAGLDLVGVQRVADETAAPEWFFHNADGSRIDGLHGHPGALSLLGVVGSALDRETARRWRRLLSELPTNQGFGAFRARHPVRVADVPEPWWGAKGMHIGANAVPHMLDMARLARAKNLLVTLDPGPRAVDLTAADLAELLVLVDAFMPSEKELAVLRRGLSPGHAACDLAQGARGLVVAKLGAGGALLASAGTDALPVPAAPAAARDPVGAGDAFCGAFLAGLAQHHSPIEAAHRAAVAAAFAVETTGALALLNTPPAALQARLALQPGAAA